MDSKTILTHFLKELLRIFVAFAILPVFWPVAIVSVSLLLIVRYIVQKVLNLVYGKDVYTLVSAKSSDGLFGHKCTGNSALIHSILILKGEPDLEKIRQRYLTHVFTYEDPITGRKNIYEKFKNILTTKLGFHCWQNASGSFDLRQHIHYAESIRPNEVYTEDKLMYLMGRLISHDKFDKSDTVSRPQWENIIIPNYRLNNESPDSRPSHFAVILRVHHAYADGASYALLVESVFADSPVKYCVDPMKPFPGMTKWKQMWINFKALTVGPLDFILTLKSSLMDDSPLILRKFSSQKFVDWSRPISLDMLKEIKHETGTSVASILICAVTGSVRNLHENVLLKTSSKRDLPVKVPETMNVGNMIGLLPYPSREPQNHFTTFSVPYPLAEENMIRRLKVTDYVGKNYLGSSEPWFHFYIMRFSSICPKIIQDFLLELPAAPIIFSNVPGFPERFKFCDKDWELVEIAAWLPLFKAYGVGVSTYSYANKLRVCVTCDSKLLDNQAQLKLFIQDIEDGLYDLAKYYGADKSHGTIVQSNLHSPAPQQYTKLTNRRLSATRFKANG